MNVGFMIIMLGSLIYGKEQEIKVRLFQDRIWLIIGCLCGFTALSIYLLVYGSLSVLTSNILIGSMLVLIALELILMVEQFDKISNEIDKIETLSCTIIQKKIELTHEEQQVIERNDYFKPDRTLVNFN